MIALLYEFAGLTVSFVSRYAATERRCAAYRAPDGAVPAFSVTLSPEEVAQEGIRSDCPPGRAEELCFHRALCRRLPEYGGFLLHASAVLLEGAAYLFTGPSGVGKSTHARLWRENFGAVSLNDDKPMLRFVAGSLCAFGTPWCGKHGLGVRSSGPVRGICFLEQGPENRVVPLLPDAVLDRIFDQIPRPSTGDEAALLLSLLDRTLRAVPFFGLTCTPTVQAAQLARQAMCGGIESVVP